MTKNGKHPANLNEVTITIESIFLYKIVIEILCAWMNMNDDTYISFCCMKNETKPQIFRQYKNVTHKFASKTSLLKTLHTIRIES